MPFPEDVESAINVALLGYGYAGRTLHEPLIASVPGLRLLTVVKSHTESPDAALLSPGVHLVVIATPNATHFPLARRALEAGKHVVVDKPFAVTVAEATELRALAHGAGRLLSVFHNRRWDGDFLTVRRVIASAQLGGIVHFESHFDRYRPEVRKRWRESGAPGSGIWFDLGSHLADQALQLFGVPERVFADLAVQRDGAVGVDYFHVLLKYQRARVILHGSNLVAESPRRFEVHGAAGSFVKYGTDTQEDALKRGERPGSAGWGADPLDGTLTLWSEGAREVRAEPTVPGNYPAYYEAVRDAIRGQGRNPVPPEQALDVMRVLALAERSANESRELRLE